MADQLNVDVKAALFTVSTYIIFAVSEKDSKQFKALIRPYEPDDLVALPPHTALYIIDKRNPIRKPTPDPPPHTSEAGNTSYADEIKKNTLEKYGARYTENRMKRTIGEESCKDEPAAASFKDDDIEPTIGPIKNVPSHGGKDQGTA
jgi:hypothetical protein